MGLQLNPGALGGILATEEITSEHHQQIKIQHGVTGAATNVSAVSGLPIIEAMESPQVTYATSAALAAGGSTDLDSDQITADKTGKLVTIVFGGTSALKAEIQTVLNSADTTRMVLFSTPGLPCVFRFPTKDFITQAYSATAGLDGFRARITNLENSQPADVYATFFYDEVA